MRRRPRSAVAVLGDNVRRLRNRLNLTQAALAVQAGISVQYVRVIEAGDRPNVGLHTIGRIARVLKTEEGVLLLAAAPDMDSGEEENADDAGSDPEDTVATGPPQEWTDAWQRLDERDRADLLALLRYKMIRVMVNPSAVWAEVEPDGWVRPIKAGQGHRAQSRSDITATTKAPRDSAEPKP